MVVASTIMDRFFEHAGALLRTEHERIEGMYGDECLVHFTYENGASTYNGNRWSYELSDEIEAQLEEAGA